MKERIMHAHMEGLGSKAHQANCDLRHTKII